MRRVPVAMLCKLHYIEAKQCFVRCYDSTASASPGKLGVRLRKEGLIGLRRRSSWQCAVNRAAPRFQFSVVQRCVS